MNTTRYLDPLVLNFQHTFGNNKHSLDILIVIVAVVICCTLFESTPKGLKLPLGPARSLFVGNMYDIPVVEEWKTYTKWVKQFGMKSPFRSQLSCQSYPEVAGEIVYLRVFGSKLLVLGSYRVANALLDKRGAIYSDRPLIPPILKM